MNKSWRPQGWHNPYEQGIETDNYGAAGYENGADAMLQFLRKQGLHMAEDGFVSATYSGPGTWVFIPDDATG